MQDSQDQRQQRHGGQDDHRQAGGCLQQSPVHERVERTEVQDAVQDAAKERLSARTVDAPDCDYQPEQSGRESEP